MTTNKPPDLAAIRALCGKLADGHGLDYVLASSEAAKALPALLDLVDELQSVIENYHDREIHAVAKARGLLG